MLKKMLYKTTSVQANECDLGTADRWCSGFRFVLLSERSPCVRVVSASHQPDERRDLAETVVAFECPRQVSRTNETFRQYRRPSFL